MGLKQRIDALTQKVQATGKPKPGVVRVCGRDAEIRQAEKELAELNDDVPRVIVHEEDMSLPRPLPKDEKK